MSKVSAYYHVVFCTKNRKMTLPETSLEDLYRFIWRQITNMNCKLIRIGGISNHIHLLIDLHQDVPLSKLIQVIKGHSSGWMHHDLRFFEFEGWGKEYFATTVTPKEKHAIIEYIKNQKLHHQSQHFEKEAQILYTQAEQTYHENDLI